MDAFYVYILANKSNVIYVGVTNNLSGRFWEHTEDRSPSFCLRYNLDRLVYYEVFPT
jgi:putative endonuclease